MHCHTHLAPQPKVCNVTGFCFRPASSPRDRDSPGCVRAPDGTCEQCVHVQSEFPPADSFSPAWSLKCFTRSSSARHGKSSADVIRPAASDSRADRRGCVSVCVRLRACQTCKKTEKNFCKHWWLCCNSIIYLPFFRNVLNQGWSLFGTQQLWKDFFFFFLVWQHRKHCNLWKFSHFLLTATLTGGSGDILSSAQRFLKPLETKPAASVNTSENKHPAPRAVSSNCPHHLALHFFSLSLSKLRHSDLLARKDPPLPPKTRGSIISRDGATSSRVESVLCSPRPAGTLHGNLATVAINMASTSPFGQKVGRLLAACGVLPSLDFPFFFLFTTWAQHHHRLPLKCVISWNSICETPERLQGLENVTSATTDREIITSFFLLSRELSL